MTRTYDAIIVGGGLNGLVCALELQKADWSTVVLERNGEVGGAVRSAEATEPGLIHDLYATNVNLFLGSPTFAEHAADLARLGFEPARSERPFASLYPHGGMLGVWVDPARTRAALAAHDAADAGGLDELGALFARFAARLMPVYAMPLPSRQALVALARAVRAERLDGTLELCRVLVESTAGLGDRYFSSREAKALVAAWGMHLDFAPETSGGAMFPLLEIFSDMQFGMSVARGGASRLPEAIAGLVRERGGEIRTDSAVARILIGPRGASGVELAAGERIAARRAVIANLAPDVLFGDGGLASVAGAAGREVRAYRRGPGTVMVHLALDGPPRWAAGEEAGGFAYLHIGPYREDMQGAFEQSRRGLLPAEPLLVCGQTSAVDSSRVQRGREILWVQVRTVPAEIAGDAGGAITARNWTAAAEPFADRVVAKLERYAPGLAAQVTARAVHTPDDLAASNANLRGGDQLGGSHQLAQNLAFRPFPGWSRYRTPVPRLLMAGASTWPGAGLNALSGFNCARELARDDSLRGRAARLARRARAIAHPEP